MGLLPLIRHEGIALVGLFSVYLLVARSSRSVLISWLPLLLYNLASVGLLKQPASQLPILMYLDLYSTTEYGSGSWFHYVPYVIWQMGYAVFFWALSGLFLLIRHRLRGGIYLLLYLGYFVVHSAIYHYGLFASGGYWFFVFPLAPALGLLAALGADHLLKMTARIRASGRQWRLLIGGIVFVPVAFTVPNVTIWRLSAEEVAVREAAVWVREHDVQPSHIIASHVWFYYDYLYSYPWLRDQRWTACRNLSAAESGTVLVWDAHYSNLCGYDPPALVSGMNAWHEVARFGEDQVIIVEKS